MAVPSRSAWTSLRLQQRASWPPSRGSCRLPEQPPRPQQPSAMTDRGYPAARVRTPRSPRSRSPSGRFRRSIPGPLHQPRGADGALPPDGREMVSLLTPAGGRALVASQRSPCQVGVAGVEVQPSPPRSDAQRHGPTAPRIGSLSPVRCEWRRCQKVSLPKAAGFPITSRSMYWMNRGAVARRCCHSAFDDDETKVSYVRGGYRGSRVSEL